MDAILTPELEAEVTVIYRELRASGNTVMVERDTMGEQRNGARVLTVCFALLAVGIVVSVPAWALLTFARHWFRP